MNAKAVGQVNSTSVPTDKELNRTNLQTNLLQLQNTDRLGKPPTGQLDSPTVNNDTPTNQHRKLSSTKKKLNNNNESVTDYPLTPNYNLENSSSYQNDNSVYYTPVYKIQNVKQKNHKSLIEPNTEPNTNINTNGNMDCSFDNSIVPVPSCSSASSRKSSLSSNQLNEHHPNGKHHKRSTRKKDDHSSDTDHKSLNKHHNSHLTGHHQRRQRMYHRNELEQNNYNHLESSNELPPNSNYTNKDEFENSQTNHSKHNYHQQNSMIENQNNPAIGTELFEHLSDRNQSPISEDSLPYFQTGSFDQDVCNKLRWKLKYHLSNPIEKWQRKRKFPFKLLLQIIKIIFVTIHVITYGSTMSRFLTHQGKIYYFQAFFFSKLLIIFV